MLLVSVPAAADLGAFKGLLGEFEQAVLPSALRSDFDRHAWRTRLASAGTSSEVRDLLLILGNAYNRPEGLESWREDLQVSTVADDLRRALAFLEGHTLWEEMTESWGDVRSAWYDRNDRLSIPGTLARSAVQGSPPAPGGSSGSGAAPADPGVGDLSRRVLDLESLLRGAGGTSASDWRARMESWRSEVRGARGRDQLLALFTEMVRHSTRSRNASDPRTPPAQGAPGTTGAPSPPAVATSDDLARSLATSLRRDLAGTVSAPDRQRIEAILVLLESGFGETGPGASASSTASRSAGARERSGASGATESVPSSNPGPQGRVYDEPVDAPRSPGSENSVTDGGTSDDRREFARTWVGGPVTSKGTAVTGVEIVAQGRDGGIAFASNASSGNYALGLGEGEWRLTASKRGYLAEPVPVRVAGGEALEEVRIELERSRAVIEGRVVDESGKPLSGALVHAMPNLLSSIFQGASGLPEHDRMPVIPALSPHQMTEARSGRGGAFRMETIRGKFLLTADLEGYEMSPRNAGATLRIPGMENMPEEQRAMMAESMGSAGVSVDLSEGETRTDVTIVLRPSSYPEIRYTVDTGRFERRTPNERQPLERNELFGRAMPTPNNVLHWTRVTRQGEGGFFAIVRHSREPGSVPAGEVKRIELPLMRFGTPGREWFSYTDHEAVSGRAYWYVLHETDGTRMGPASNAVRLETR